jgi:hypothetical protein
MKCQVRFDHFCKIDTTSSLTLCYPERNPWADAAPGGKKQPKKKPQKSFPMISPTSKLRRSPRSDVLFSKSGSYFGDLKWWFIFSPVLCFSFAGTVTAIYFQTLLLDGLPASQNKAFLIPSVVQP